MSSRFHAEILDEHDGANIDQIELRCAAHHKKYEGEPYFGPKQRRSVGGAGRLEGNDQRPRGGSVAVQFRTRSMRVTEGRGTTSPNRNRWPSGDMS